MTSWFWLWLVWRQLIQFLWSWEAPLYLLSWRGQRYFLGLPYHRSLSRFFIIWYVLVLLLGFTFWSCIVRLLRCSKWSGLWVRGIPLLDLLVWRLGSETSGCRSLNYGDSDLLLLGQQFFPIWVSATLDKCWDFLLAWSGHVGHYVERVDVEGRCCV